MLPGNFEGGRRLKRQRLPPRSTSCLEELLLGIPLALSSLKHSGKFCFAALSYSFSCSAFGGVACVNISRQNVFFSYSNKYASILSYVYIPSRFAFSSHSHRTILQYFWLNVGSALSTHRALLFCGGSRDDRRRQMSHCIGNARSSTCEHRVIERTGSM